MKRAVLVAIFGLVGCETYDLPPVLSGVDVDGDEVPDCESDTCRVLQLEPSQVPQDAPPLLEATFIAEDDRGALGEVWVSLVAPSGASIDIECVYSLDAPLGVPGCTSLPASTAPQPKEEGEDESGAAAVDVPVGGEDGELRRQLRGVTLSRIVATVSGRFEEVGTHTLEVWAVDGGGQSSNRLSRRFEVQ